MEAIIEFKGVKFDVEFDYQPEEKMVMYYKDGSGDPGCAENITLHEMTHKGTCFMEWIEDDHEKIEEIISNQLAEQRLEALDPF